MVELCANRAAHWHRLTGGGVKPPKGAMVKSSRRFGTERLGNPVPRVQAGMDNGDELTVTADEVSRSLHTFCQKL
jgi:hypothetical protein